MLNVLRDNFKNAPYLRLVLLGVGVALVISLGSGFDINCTGATGDWAARVNGTEIPVRTFLARARNIDQYYRQLFGDNYEQIKDSLRIGQQAIENLVEQELILQDAARLGLRSSKDELARQIRTDPMFQDATGQFVGSERYQQLVQRQVPGGVAAYERELADGFIAAKWAGLVTQPVGVADNELEKIFRQRTEKSAIDYIVFPTAEQEIDTEVSDAALQQWYETHPDDYQREEGWKIRYVMVDRDEQRSKVAISAEQVKDSYETNAGSYQHPEQRRVRHILFRLETDATPEDRQRASEAAEAALVRLRAGEEFGTLARTLSDDSLSAENDGDLGFFGRGDMVGPFEEAAFQSAVGEFAPITESPFGLHVIEVTDQREAGLTPLADVEESIRGSLELQAAQQLVGTEAERLKDAIGTADGLQSVAEAEGLEVLERNVSRGESLRDIGAAADFLTVLAAMQPGDLSPPLSVATGMILVALDELLPPAVAPLDDVRDAVMTAVLDDRRLSAALIAAELAMTQHDGPATAAATLALELQSSGDLAPGQALPGGGAATPELEERLFGESVRVADRGVIGTPTGAIFFEISSREPFDPLRFEEQKSTLRQEALTQRRGRYRQSIVQRLRESQPVEINAALLEQYSG